MCPRSREGCLVHRVPSEGACLGLGVEGGGACAHRSVCCVCVSARIQHPSSKGGTVQGATYRHKCGGRRGAVKCGWQGLPYGFRMDMSTADVMAGDQPTLEGGGGAEGGSVLHSGAVGRAWTEACVPGWERGLVKGADGWRDS